MRVSSVAATALLLLSSVHARMERRCAGHQSSDPDLPVTASVDTGDSQGSNSTSSITSSAYSSTSTSSTSTQKGSSSSASTSTTTSANATSTSVKNTSNGKVYSIQEQYSGVEFFDGFNFETFADPTHGNVNYVNADTAYKTGLAYVDENNTVIMSVDNTKTVAVGGNRDSIRISSKNTYSKGLIVLDVQSMPTGCGVWPAFWTVGDSWPKGGEIDIVEGVNNQANAQYTLHTSSGCTLDTSFQKANKKRLHRVVRGTTSPNSISSMAFTGKVLSTTCDASLNSNSGCGIQDPDNKSLSAGLNARGGGVFATLLNSDGVAIWFFPRGSIPSDLTSQKPVPSGWGSPKAFWSSSSCPTNSFFGPQRIVINTTLCGDWAGAAYAGAGCPGTCAQRLANPRNFDDAQWKIKSVTVYN